ncbi:Heat induced stress protein YflT [Jeotgalicoccus saudimassiliensis]|uniref:Heat induced stress protein YflT n=1 Tax=Jeotgalicoccus saudimassiliensis TaxID=1461582 RepID=A0A078M4B6_9STAP|nr:general stress protein [Jeotgalicoccus saudimassiliensis]CEA02348.1 Heat induced stress protein YflT [Jeotgalicoccus saudimassiliensis]
MTTIEIYSNADELSDKIYSLRAEGVKDSNMTVVSKDRFKATFLRYTRVPFRKADGTMWDKVAAKFLDEDSKERVAEQLNLTGEDYSRFREAIDSGNILLLVRSEEDKVKQDEAASGSPETQDEAMKAAAATPSQPLQISHDAGSDRAKAKKKHDSYMDAAEIIHEDGSRRTVKHDGNSFTIVNMKKELKDTDNSK